MVLLLRLLSVLPRAFRDIMIGIAAGAPVIFGDANLEAFQRWLWGTPQKQILVEPLSPEAEVLYAQLQQLMDAQFQVGELKRIILTLPALPEEGY
jgi:hypothetical protein